MTAADAQPPAVWWSPSLLAKLDGNGSGLIETYGNGFWRQNTTGGWTGIPSLPADAVRLVADPGALVDDAPEQVERLAYAVIMDHPGLDAQGLAAHIADALLAHDLIASPAAALAGTTTPTAEEAEFVEEALRCADTGNAGHWPTAAGYLADEVRRLRALLASTPTVEEPTS